MSVPPQLPKPSFDVLVQVLATPVYVHLGLLDNPTTGRAEKDADQARWALDLLHVLRDALDRGVSADERRRLDQMLHQLREAARGT